jgi:hypothetical protein
MNTRTHKHMPRKLQHWMIITALVLLFTVIGITFSYVLHNDHIQSGQVIAPVTNSLTYHA